MAKVITIISEKYLNQFTNGEDFSLNTSDVSGNLLGNVGEKVKAIVKFAIGWEANANALDAWQVNATSITRTSGSFLDDGFRVGQEFDYISAWSDYADPPTVDFNGTVSSISTDGRQMVFVVNSGAVTTGQQLDVGIKARADASANYLTALVWRFGLVGNDDDYSNISNVSGNQQAYLADGIGLGGPRSTTPVAMIPQGTYRDWVSGSASVNFDSETDYTQIFEVSHEFIITPFYLEGQLEDLQETTLPEYLEGESTLKYSFQAEFRQSLSNPNVAITTTYDDNLGSVGWFGENFNGLGSDYAIVSVDYEDVASASAVEALQAKASTKATVIVQKLSGAFSAGQQARVYVVYLASQSQYQNRTTDLAENFLYESLASAEGDAPVSGTIISNLELTLDAGDLVAEFEVSYSAIQQAYISGGAYLIAIQVADSALASQVSDRVLLLADARAYISNQDVQGLHGFDKFDIHFADSEAGTDAGYTSFSGFNEDTLALEFEFWLDLAPTKLAYLEGLEFALVAYNTVTGTSFGLDRTTLAIAQNSVIASGIQQIEIDTQRAYPYEDGNQYRAVTVTTGSAVGTKQYYSGVFGQKLRWEDWLANLQADADFYNASEQNNNLNFRSSNYSGLLDYEIRLEALATVEGVDSSGQTTTTVYRTLSNALTVGPYGDNGDFTAVVALFDEGGSNSTGGAILQGQNTLVRATFTAALGAISDITGYQAIIRMQVADALGQQIEEIATYYSGIGNLLIPKSGESFVTLALDSGNAVAECLIDGTKAEAGASYFISARLLAPDPPVTFVEFMNTDLVLFMNDDFAKFMNQ